MENDFLTEKKIVIWIIGIMEIIIGFISILVILSNFLKVDDVLLHLLYVIGLASGMLHIIAGKHLIKKRRWALVTSLNIFSAPIIVLIVGFILRQSFENLKILVPFLILNYGSAFVSGIAFFAVLSVELIAIIFLIVNRRYFTE